MHFSDTDEGLGPLWMTGSVVVLARHYGQCQYTAIEIGGGPGLILRMRGDKPIYWLDPSLPFTSSSMCVWFSCQRHGLKLINTVLLNLGKVKLLSLIFYKINKKDSNKLAVK